MPCKSKKCKKLTKEDKVSAWMQECRMANKSITDLKKKNAELKKEHAKKLEELREEFKAQERAFKEVEGRIQKEAQERLDKCNAEISRLEKIIKDKSLGGRLKKLAGKLLRGSK